MNLKLGDNLISNLFESSKFDINKKSNNIKSSKIDSDKTIENDENDLTNEIEALKTQRIEFGGDDDDDNDDDVDM